MRPVKIKTIQEMEKMFRDDPGFMKELLATILSTNYNYEAHLESNRKTAAKARARKKSLEKESIKQAV